MYELVNTSVPNGLIAGTHGFATVAMTKGMPDAIRTRVEGLCAYPHRTSAHDESYYRENPVNWFHLILPSGDHVVGRTAPSDFDYTGRTNRLARTIVFRRGEMPVSGGCEAIRIAGPHLSEKWSSEPRMLPADKALAAKFFALERSSDATPANWVALFGDKGISLAKRVAMLVARNAMGGGKSVYFKTSTSWDADGTKLLALFSDVINLLPDEAAPLVTFSTFAACVPNGVSCHLRGIYDKDRAFEVASATQPWVDCEHGCVMHEELLPKEGAAAAAVVDSVQSSTSGVGSSVVNSGRASDIGLRKDDSAKAAQAVRNRNSRWQRQDDSDKSLYITIGVLAAIVVCVAIGCVVWIQKSSSSAVETDEIMREAKAEAKQEKNPAEEERIAEPRRQDEAKKEELEKKKEEKNKEREEVERKQKEAEEIAKAEAEGKKIVEDARKKAGEETKREAEALKKAKEQCLKMPLGDLKLTEVVSTSIHSKDYFEVAQGKKSDHILAKHVSSITNNDSIIVYYMESKTPRKVFCKYDAKTRTVNRKTTTTFTVVGWPEKANESPWVVCRVVNPDYQKVEDETSLAVYWWWNVGVNPEPWFEKSDNVNLKDACFCSEEAYKLYAGFRSPKPVFYKVLWREGEKMKCRAFNTRFEELKIEKFEPDQKDITTKITKLEEEKDAWDSDVKALEKRIKDAEQLSKDVEKKEQEIISLLADKEKEKDGAKKKAKGAKLTNRKNEINTEIGPALKAIGIMGQQLTGNEQECIRIVDAINNKKKGIEGEKKRKEDAAEQCKDKIQEVREAAKKWKGAVRHRMFSVTAVDEVGSKGDGGIYEEEI